MSTLTLNRPPKNGRRISCDAAKRILSRRWPHLFTNPVPLRVGIHLEYARLPNRPMSNNNFRRFLRAWTQQPEYLAAVEKGQHRRGFGDAEDTFDKT